MKELLPLGWGLELEAYGHITLAFRAMERAGDRWRAGLLSPAPEPYKPKRKTAAEQRAKKSQRRAQKAARRATR